MALLTTALFVAVGCTGSATPEDGESITPDEDAVASNASTSVAIAQATNQPSPAAGVSNLPPVDAPPEEVCQKFMDLLQAGNRLAAENLLTRTALVVTEESGLHLEPMGGPTAVYSVTDVRYATNKQKLAQVECLVSDDEDGMHFEMPITWFVRKQRTGWRISGVLLEIEPGQAPDLLSFENAIDVVRMKAMAGEDVMEADLSTRQADADPKIPNIK